MDDIYSINMIRMQRENTKIIFLFVAWVTVWQSYMILGHKK